MSMSTKSNVISLVVCPCWGVYFPPYNISRLSSVLRQEGYEVNVHDVNVEAYHHLKELTDVDYWSGEKYFHWYSGNFQNDLFPQLKEFLDKKVDDILAFKSNIIGFSLYSTNMACSFYMIRQIKLREPNITIVCGGPACFLEFKPIKEIDYVVVGEGEETFLKLLDTCKKGNNDQTITMGELRTRLNINGIPSPDYSDFDFSNYTKSNGISIETSRGCVAQCTFCTETWFWKYRWRTASSVIEEMKEQIDKYNISYFWFIDSLINGNLKEFRQLVDDILSNNLEIRWQGYARCDGRMDLDFMKKVSLAGCNSLSFGIESGSEKVLNDMKKKIEIYEIEQNLHDGSVAGIHNHTNWVLGFPTEDKLEYFHTLALIYNCRNWIDDVSPGMGCGISPNTVMDEKREMYDIMPRNDTFLQSWYTKDYKNTKLHRFIRVKLFHIWLKIIDDYTDSEMINGQYHDNIDEFYNIILYNRDDSERIEQNDNIDFRYAKHNGSYDFVNSITNEYFPLFYAIYNAFGAFSINILFDNDKDIPEFGDLIACFYNANISFNIDEKGNFEFSIDHKFDHLVRNRVTPVYETKKRNMSFIQKWSSDGNIDSFKKSLNK